MISARQLLFQSREVPFAAMPLHPSDISERAYLESGESPSPLDVSDRHWIVCSDPFIIAIWVHERFESDVRLTVTFDRKVVGYIDLEFVQHKSLTDGRLMLFRSTGAVSRHAGFLRRHAMLSYLRLAQNSGSYKNTVNYCVGYSYPRNVVLVSFRKNGYFNIFPMDFQGRIPESDTYLFGLRTTNLTLGKVMEQKQVVVCEVPATQREIVYQLGKHHSSAPPSMDTLPFACQSSERFSFPVPSFALTYAEIELHDFEPLGSHMLMIGRAVNRVTLSPPARQLYHIHSMQVVHKPATTSGSK